MITSESSPADLFLVVDRCDRCGARAQVRELVIQERGGGPRVTVAQVIAATGLKERRAYELLRDARAD